MDSANQRILESLLSPACHPVQSCIKSIATLVVFIVQASKSQFGTQTND